MTVAKWPITVEQKVFYYFDQEGDTPAEALAAALRRVESGEWPDQNNEVSTDDVRLDWEPLLSVVRLSWGADTAVDPEQWHRPGASLSTGQCAVTALVLQDYMGGHLERADVLGQSHYWLNVDGRVVDITADQFGDVVIDRAHATVRPRAYVLSFPDTVRRYEILRDRVAKRWGA